MMSFNSAVLLKEELIDIALLTEIINNYCITTSIVIEFIPKENTGTLDSILEPELLSVDLKPLIKEEIIIAISKIVKKIEMKSFIEHHDSEQ